MKKLAILILFALSCKGASAPATAHLKMLGYKDVACDDGQREVTCRADGQVMHCVVYDPDGCESGPRTACERATNEPQ